MPFIIDSHTGQPPADMSRGYERRQVPFGKSPFAAAWDGETIPRSEWRDRIDEMERQRTGLNGLCEQAGLSVLDQNGTNYCWANGVVHCVEVQRVAMGEPVVPLSAASVAAPIKNYRNVGGWGEQALGYIRQHGIAPQSLWPNAAINRRYDNDRSRRERLKYRVTDFVDIPEDLDVVMTLLFRGIPVSVAFNWWGHLVMAVDPVYSGGDFGYRIRNSWGSRWGDNGTGVLLGRKAVPSEAIAIMVSTAGN